MKYDKVIRTSTPKAREDHICDVCRKVIPKGEMYLNVTIRKGKKLISRKTHFDCCENKNHQELSLVPHNEQEFKEKVHDETLEMIEKFTYNENMKIALLPLIITEIVWVYASKVVKYASEYKIEETKKLSRAVKMLREKYLNECSKDLDKDHIRRMQNEANEFILTYAHDFTVMYFSLNNELKKQWASICYLDMRTEACMAMLMLKVLKEHNQKMDKLMSEKFGRNVPEYRNPINDALYDCMDSYASPCNINFDCGNAMMSMKIVLRKLNDIQWVVTK